MIYGHSFSGSTCIYFTFTNYRQLIPVWGVIKLCGNMSHLVCPDILDLFLCQSVKSLPIGVNVQTAGYHALSGRQMTFLVFFQLRFWAGNWSFPMNKVPDVS